MLTLSLRTFFSPKTGARGCNCRRFSKLIWSIFIISSFYRKSNAIKHMRMSKICGWKLFAFLKGVLNGRGGKTLHKHINRVAAVAGHESVSWEAIVRQREEDRTSPTWLANLIRITLMLQRVNPYDNVVASWRVCWSARSSAAACLTNSTEPFCGGGWIIKLIYRKGRHTILIWTE